MVWVSGRVSERKKCEFGSMRSANNYNEWCGLVSGLGCGHGQENKPCHCEMPQRWGLFGGEILG